MRPVYLPVGVCFSPAAWLQERGKMKAWVKRGGEMPRGESVWGLWLLGYLEGYDWGCSQDKPTATGLDTEAVFERIDGICRSHAKPDAYPLLLAPQDLIKQLDPKHLGVCDH